jgi:ATP-binding cassette subfamily C (CFTR/MRP) protein 1
MVFCPAAAFAVYAIDASLRGQASLDTTKAFTSLALIMLVSQPVSRLLCAIPNAASSIGCFDRIQEYLLSRSFSDARTLLRKAENIDVGTSRFCDTDSQLSFEVITQGELDKSMIVMNNVTIRLADSPVPILENINVKFQKGKLAIITGPIASGKSTLLKSLLGELQPSSGEITIRSNSIAYCSQIPWLPNNAIHNIICESSTSDIDGEWYRTVIGACALYSDLLAMADGDQTVVGTRGSSLSGGQKLRVALARAVYARADVLLLDDVLSCLDERTKGFVVERLFGTEGLCRKLGITVVLVTHAGK